jgi:hypothetical protein
LVLAALGWVQGCAHLHENQATAGAYDSPLLRSLDLNQPVQPIALPGAIDLSAAKNEWVSFSLAIQAPDGESSLASHTLRIVPPTTAGATPTALPAGVFSAWQILAMPVDLNRASYVRHTGFTSDAATQPRALYPLKIKDGAIDLRQLVGPSASGGAAQIWVDLHVPTTAAPGKYAARCDLLAGESALASVDVHLTVYDFALPDERHLQLLSPLDWDRLTQLYREPFEAVRPTLLNRDEPRYAPTIRTLDQLVALAEANRCEAFVPRLGPVVKWPVGQKPDVDWEDFVAVVSPWMNGDGFVDHQPLGFWPLPQPEMLPRYDRQSQLDYDENAANRFDQNDWLTRSAVMIDPPHPGRTGPADSIELSLFASEILDAQPRIRVAVPLEDDQLLLANANRPKMIEPSKAGRLLCSAPGLVYAPPMRTWPQNTPRPRRWLRTDLPGLVPYAGAGGDERDVRLYAWLAYLRGADLVMFPGSLPTVANPQQASDPNELTWFYPGQWFGLDEPLPTLQLKWLRRAEQDYEYLLLAKNRGDVFGPLLTARAITKPVQILSTESPDPVYALMSGTVDPHAWRDVKDLIAHRILARDSHHPADAQQMHALDMQSLYWLEPQDRQYQLGRSVDYLLDPSLRDSVALRFGVDIYNASDDTPSANTLNWTRVPPAWTIRPQGRAIPSLGMFEVNHSTLEATVSLDRLSTNAAGTTAKPVEWAFTNGFTRKSYEMKAVVPVAPSDRRALPLKIDGSLADWDAADAIQSGPMTRFLARPALQRQQLEPATHPTHLYTSWGDDDFYVAFKLEGVTAPQVYETRNFVNYQARRAWGEDLCELLIQPQYEDNTLGPVLHVVCKPTGQWVEKKLDPRHFADPWQPIEGLAIRYAGTVDGGVWRGELAIPWKALVATGKDRPPVLRFNVVHHVGATGESASWAGPIDFGRDESFMGLLYLRDLDAQFYPRPRQTTITESRP